VQKNQLYYGDNLAVLREYIRDESVDLIYLDPPFNSRQDYNVLFAERDGTRSASQIMAFEDTWEWNMDAERAYEEIVERGGRVSDAMRAFRTFLGHSDMMAYLAMMAPRLIELHRVLKVTGSIYLHCDPTASHYLKILMDAVFAPHFFRNEIVWSRATPRGHAFTRFASSHDLLLFYSRGDTPTWNGDAAFLKYDLSELDDKTDSKYALRDADGRRYQLTSLLNPNRNRPHLTYEFLGITRVWRWTRDRMTQAYEQGLVVQPRPGAVPRFKRYLDVQKGKPLVTSGQTFPRSTLRRRNASATQPKSRRLCSHAFSVLAPRRAMSFSIRSVDAAPRLPSRNASIAAGSALTLRISPSASSRRDSATPSAKRYAIHTK